MNKKETAKRFSEALYSSGLTARELSKRAKINEASVSQYLSGTHVIGYDNAVKVAEVLNTTPEYLMGISVSNSVAGSEGYMISVSNKFTLPTEILKLNKTNFDRMIEYGKKLLELQDLEDIE